MSEATIANAEKIVSYLKRGICVAGCPKFVPDIFDPTSKVALTVDMYTDGSFLWQGQLAYYVQKYHLSLPPDFVEHMASRGWEPPKRGEIDLKSLTW
jgi:hypothetical protein